MMNDSRGTGQPAPVGGLCPRCANVTIIISDRGSRFYLCRLSVTDERFPKYPPQPVLACGGFAGSENG